MAKAMKSKQFTFSLPNRIGLLSEVATALADAKVNIEAICAYERGYGFFMMIADDPAKAKKGAHPDGSQSARGGRDSRAGAEQGRPA